MSPNFNVLIVIINFLLGKNHRKNILQRTISRFWSHISSKSKLPWVYGSKAMIQNIWVCMEKAPWFWTWVCLTACCSPGYASNIPVAEGCNLFQCYPGVNCFSQCYVWDGIFAVHSSSPSALKLHELTTSSVLILICMSILLLLQIPIFALCNKSCIKPSSCCWP